MYSFFHVPTLSLFGDVCWVLAFSSPTEHHQFLPRAQRNQLAIVNNAGFPFLPFNSLRKMGCRRDWVIDSRGRCHPEARSMSPWTSTYAPCFPGLCVPTLLQLRPLGPFPVSLILSPRKLPNSHAVGGSMWPVILPLLPFPSDGVFPGRRFLSAPLAVFTLACLL